MWLAVLLADVLEASKAALALPPSEPCVPGTSAAQPQSLRALRLNLTCRRSEEINSFGYKLCCKTLGSLGSLDDSFAMEDCLQPSGRFDSRG